MTVLIAVNTALPSHRWRLDDVRVMHPVAEALQPVLGRTSWLVQHGYGSFITMEFGEPHVHVRKPLMLPVSIAGAPAKTLQRLASVSGQWHLWIYCCEWSLRLESTELAHSESDDITLNRALGVLNGQELQAVDVDPAGGQTRFTFDLGCSLSTCPAPPGSYDDPVRQWMLYSRPGPGLAVLSIRGDGTYSIDDGHTKPGRERWLPIDAPVRVHR
jgi:hypothetical protein